MPPRAARDSESDLEDWAARPSGASGGPSALGGFLKRVLLLLFLLLAFFVTAGTLAGGPFLELLLQLLLFS